ncbi:MAG: chorismate-binding protein, partial [Microbacteriaceae bacterium]
MSTEQQPPSSAFGNESAAIVAALPALLVQTKRTESFAGLAAADPVNPLYWAHEDFELVGIGDAHVFEFHGPSRFTEARNVWQALVARAEVSDELKLSGTGLVAFTSFAFDDHSQSTSYLILPQTILGRNQQTSWQTELQWVETKAGVQSDFAPLAERNLSELLTPSRTLSGVHRGQSQFSAEDFKAAVASSTKLIAHGALEKVVLARDLVLETHEHPDYRLTLLSLAERYRNCWTFAVRGLIGSSPETLLELHRGEFQVRVLAGSAARGDGGDGGERDAEQREALLNSAKNRQEHHFAVESALASLAEVVETLETDETFALQLPNLWHLATDIHGKLDEHTSPIDVIAALHPTAAVAGTPTPDALELIRTLEPFDRG